MQPRAPDPVPAEYERVVHDAAARHPAGDRADILNLLKVAQAAARFNDFAATWLPYVLWLMMPLYALLLRVFFRGRHFIDHLVFALWGHSIALVLLMLLAGANALGANLGLIALAPPYLGYFGFAARRYYDQKWAAVTAKSAGHLVLYCALGVIPAYMLLAVIYGVAVGGAFVGLAQ